MIKKFICHYRTLSGDSCRIMLHARDHADAASQCYSDTSYKPFVVEIESKISNILISGIDDDILQR